MFPFFLFITKIDKAVFFALMSLILGIVLEGIQFYVPFREFSIMDIGANEIGILLGILLGEKVHNYLIEKGKSNVLPSSLFFDPDFNYRSLKPKEKEDGKMDFYNLGYVQNVIRNQVIAEFLEISPEEVDKYDERFIYKERNFPIGSNCAVNPKNPNQLISLVNGYVFYDEKGNISVKKIS